MEKYLIIRTDASAQIGTGHLMRCLALAQAWQDTLGGGVTFITTCQSDGLLQRLREEDFTLHTLANSYPDPSDWDCTKDILTAHPTAWVVLDGYHFDEFYQQKVKGTGHRLLVIDDMAHLKHYYADIVLNQNLHAEQLHYSCEPDTRLLMGTRYVLLRRGFLAWRDWQREIPEVARRVLVTLGGSDPENHTLRVIQALHKVAVPNLEVTVVIGASNPHTDTLEAATGQSRVPTRLVHDVRNMPQLMSQSDLAIIAIGITLWEICFMGLPVITIAHSDKQVINIQAINKAGIAWSLGLQKNMDGKEIAEELKAIINSKEMRTSMSCAQRETLDGQGARRVLSKMKEL